VSEDKKALLDRAWGSEDERDKALLEKMRQRYARTDDEVLSDPALQRFYKSWMEKHGDRMKQSFEERHQGAFMHALDVEVKGFKEDLIKEWRERNE